MKPWTERIEEAVNSYDARELDALAAEATTDAQRRQLVEDGYLQFASVLQYDMACHKAGEGTAEFVLELIETASNLVDRPLWFEKGVAFIGLMEQETNSLQQIIEFGGRAIAAFENVPEHPVSARDMAYVRYFLARHDRANQDAHWFEALRSIKSVEAAFRGFGLEIRYVPLEGESATLTQRRHEECARYEAELEAAPVGTHADVLIAIGLHQVLSNPSAQVPTRVYERQLLRAMQWRPVETPVADVREAAHFFDKEGTRLGRPDLNAHAVTLFRGVLADPTATGFEVYYLAKALEKVGRIDEAWGVYRRYLDSIRGSFSPLSHYIEFLERVRARSDGGERPTVAELRELAELGEHLGNGYYSGPGMVLTRLALKEGDEVAARKSLTRLLLLHELCIDREIIRLREWVRGEPAVSAEFTAFLDETLAFMTEVTANYWFDPSVKWAELKSMSAEVVKVKWAERQSAIRSRPKRPEPA